MTLQTFFRYYVPALLWAAAVLLLTLLPTSALPPQPEWELLSFDTFCHAVVFALLAFLVLRVFYLEFGAHSFGMAAIFSFLLCLFFGIIIELLQTIMNLGRQGEITDVLSNVIGEIIGLLVFYFLLTRKWNF